MYVSIVVVVWMVERLPRNRLVARSFVSNRFLLDCFSLSMHISTVLFLRLIARLIIYCGRH